MAGFHNKTFKKHDDYMTPKQAWEDIKDYIPRDKEIWEAFYGDGKSGEYLEELGFNVIHEDIDFFDNDLGDIIVSNPPFSKSKIVMERLAELDKPFIIIMPSSKINTGYMRETFMNKGLQIIIPRKRATSRTFSSRCGSSGWSGFGSGYLLRSLGCEPLGSRFSLRLRLGFDLAHKLLSSSEFGIDCITPAPGAILLLLRNLAITGNEGGKLD